MNNNSTKFKKTKNLNKPKIRQEFVYTVKQFINNHKIKNSSINKIKEFLDGHFFLNELEIDEILNWIIKEKVRKKKRNKIVIKFKSRCKTCILIAPLK